MKNRTFTCIAVLCTLASVAAAHDGATGIVKTRMDLMGELGDASRAAGDMFKGKAAFDRDTIGTTARLFLTHGERIPDLFPDSEHSRTGSMTDALPSVWEQRDAFDRLNASFVEGSRALLDGVEQGADEAGLKRLFFTAVRDCSSCHDDFRKPKD